MSKKKKWASCGCCYDFNYQYNENGKGSQYRIGDDDEVPHKKTRRKKKEKKNYWFTGCHHVYVWVKEIHPNRKFNGWKWVETGDGETIRYRHRCIGCGLTKRHSWSYVPPEEDIYQTSIMDAYGEPL